MSHIVESCSLAKLYDGLSRLHSAHKDAVLWLTMVDDTHTRRRRLLDGTIGVVNDSFPDPEVERIHLLTVAVWPSILAHNYELRP